MMWSARCLLLAAALGSAADRASAQERTRTIAPGEQITVDNKGNARQVVVNGNLRLALGMSLTSFMTAVQRAAPNNHGQITLNFGSLNWYYFVFDRGPERKLVSIWINSGY
jgi:hypothetical protein